MSGFTVEVWTYFIMYPLKIPEPHGDYVTFSESCTNPCHFYNSLEKGDLLVERITTARHVINVGISGRRSLLCVFRQDEGSRYSRYRQGFQPEG